MFNRLVEVSLILSVLPALAAAQSTTQAAKPTDQPKPAALTAQAINSGRATAYYRPPVTSPGSMVTNGAAKPAPFVPPAKAAVPAPATAFAGVAVPQNPAAKPVVAAVLPAVPAVAIAVPAVPAGPSTAPPAEVATNMAVDYRQGQLTLVADHAPLGKVLDLVAARIGASIDVSLELKHELVAARLGPATPNDVLTALLDGPQIDYIILGSDNLGGVQRVVVRRKQSFGRQPAAVASQSIPRRANAAEFQTAQQQGETQAQPETAPTQEPAVPQDNPPSK